MAKPIDLSGQRFGRLVAQSPSVESGKIRKWNCLCDCGNVSVVATNKLRSGHTKSCGCIIAEVSKINGLNNWRHGCGHGAKNKYTGAYRSWGNMRERCRDKTRKGYGADGVTVAKEWDDFRVFLEDMGERPEGMTLDRIDVCKGYSKENCRWASLKQQQRNRKITRYLIIDGVAVSLMEVAETLGIKKTAAQYFFSVAKKMEDHYGHIPSIKIRSTDFSDSPIGAVCGSGN